MYHLRAFFHQKLNWLVGKLVPQELDPESAAVIQHSLLEVGHWDKIIIGACFASAIKIALVCAEPDSRPLPIFHFLSFSILFGFASLFMSKAINTKFPNTARVLEGASVFFVVTAFFIAISIPFPLYLKLTVLVAFTVCLILVILRLYNRFYR
ncbi:hypothetical protein FNV43_RR20733 [Rhamnella rubrinervis]|uniref:Uncharacterized protein n=1 Tax=Rhamnella rubrinervis TaxID=2594499 RepID=A0A8K0E728_9ROSA|nr:hypothetical protein FNV43_RR20733 [Rhamnella rubrinervis]